MYRLIYKKGNILIKKVIPLIPALSGTQLGEWRSNRDKAILYTNVPVDIKRLRQYLDVLNDNQKHKCCP